jgi:hypothetical protein
MEDFREHSVRYAWSIIPQTDVIHSSTVLPTALDYPMQQHHPAHNTGIPCTAAPPYALQ